jgi:hypothetical protein
MIAVDRDSSIARLRNISTEGRGFDQRPHSKRAEVVYETRLSR